MTWAFDQEPGNATQKLVLIALAKHCGSTNGNVCWPGQETIAAFAVCSTDTVRRALKDLAASGFITINPDIEVAASGRPGFVRERDGKRTFDRYKLMFDVTTTAPDGRKVRHLANCGMAAADGASHAKTAAQTTSKIADDSHPANCGMDGSSHPANHPANHPAICGVNLIEPLEPSPPTPATGDASCEGGGVSKSILKKVWPRDALDAIEHLRGSPTKAHVASVLLDTVAPLFGPPTGIDPASYIRQLTRLGEFPAPVLVRLADWLVETRKRDLPAVADLVQRARAISAQATGHAIRSGPSIEITANDTSWIAWLEHVNRTTGAAHAATIEAVGRMIVTARWPHSANAVILSPRPPAAAPHGEDLEVLA